MKSPLYLFTLALNFGACNYVLANDSVTAPTSHCNSDEDVLFNCKVANSKKMASICGAKYVATDESFLQSYVQYRFGLPGRIEFAYPATIDHVDMLNKFRANAEIAADQSFSDSYLNFQNQGYIYEIRYSEEHITSYKRSATISVWKEGKRGKGGEMRTLVCRNKDKHIELYMGDIVARFSSPGVRYWEQLQ